MKRKTAFFTLVGALTACFVYGQRSDSLRITAVKTSEDTVLKYRINIVNYSDSIVVLPHSVFFDINETGNIPLGLALYTTGQRTNYYSLLYAWRDTGIDAQKYPLSVDYILPFQKLEFDIAIKPLPHPCILIVEYFSIYDFDYRNFLRSTGDDWQRKFTIRRTNITLEK